MFFYEKYKMAISIKNKRLRSIVILGSGVVLFPAAFSFSMAMIIFVMHNIRMSFIQFFMVDFSISCAMSILLWHLDKNHHDNQI